MRQLGIAFFLSVLLAPRPTNAKDQPKVAPLAAVVLNAKSVFLANGGGSDLAFDAFCSEIKTWGKYEVAGSPDQADLILELTSRTEEHNFFAGSPTETHSNIVEAHSVEIVDPQLILTIYDPSLRTSLWSEIDHRRLARTEKNREKETLNSVQRLVEGLKARLQ